MQKACQESHHWQIVAPKSANRVWTPSLMSYRQLLSGPAIAIAHTSDEQLQALKQGKGPGAWPYLLLLSQACRKHHLVSEQGSPFKEMEMKGWRVLWASNPQG